MTTSDKRAPLATGVALVMGGGLGVLLAVLLDWPLAITIVVGAALGLVIGAAIDATRRTDGSRGTGASTGPDPTQT